MKMTYVLNGAILTDYGIFEFTRITLQEAKVIVHAAMFEHQFQSAIGHNGTALLLSKILECNIPANRIQIRMQTEDYCVVFRLLTRLPEGTVLTEEELTKLPYEFGLLTRTK